MLPDGLANPDALRMDEDAVAFIRQFVDLPAFTDKDGRGDLRRSTRRVARLIDRHADGGAGKHGQAK